MVLADEAFVVDDFVLFLEVDDTTLVQVDEVVEGVFEVDDDAVEDLGPADDEADLARVDLLGFNVDFVGVRAEEVDLLASGVDADDLLAEVDVEEGFLLPKSEVVLLLRMILLGLGLDSMMALPCVDLMAKDSLSLQF